VLRLPTGEGVRCDAGIREGQSVTPAFDSMLAKLVAHGETRALAIARLTQALDEFVLLGVPTNLDYLGRVLRTPRFATGPLHTGFLQAEAGVLAPRPPPAAELDAAALAAALLDRDFARGLHGTPEPYASIGAWRN
jgi:propionyl-CoA carboxylase alpha chain/3-methylcrotonyl-CoA carboxylase alpha subunit/acetyl-CoA/propionyl-CoA carboxylase biotin carboxyl carrier protein